MDELIQNFKALFEYTQYEKKLRDAQMEKLKLENTAFKQIFEQLTGQKLDGLGEEEGEGEEQLENGEQNPDEKDQDQQDEDENDAEKEEQDDEENKEVERDDDANQDQEEPASKSLKPSK